MSFKLGDDFAKEFVSQWNRRIRGMRWFGFALGSIMMIFGAFCFVRPSMVTELSAILLAGAIIVLGVYRLVEYFSTPILFRFGGKLISGIFNLIIGYLLLSASSEATQALFTTIIAIDLFLVGIEKLIFAGKLRFFGASDYSWIIADGTLNLIASSIFFFLPGVSSVMLGVFIGIFMVFVGASVLIECINAKEYLLTDKAAKKRNAAARKRLADIEEAEIKKK